MQYIAAPSPRLPVLKTVVSRALSGTGNAVHFSLITTTKRPPEYFARKHFCSYCRHEEGFLNNRGAGGGRCSTQSLSLAFAQPPRAHKSPLPFKPPPRAATGSKDCAAIRARFTHIMSLWMWNSGRLGQVYSLPMSSKMELHPVRPAASPLAPAGVIHASVEPDSLGEITL